MKEAHFRGQDNIFHKSPEISVFTWNVGLSMDDEIPLESKNIFHKSVMIDMSEQSEVTDCELSHRWNRSTFLRTGAGTGLNKSDRTGRSTGLTGRTADVFLTFD